ncbi:hypothetical protein DCAR_0624781 [Daucus carota subsp. sativus]|uniref:Uncharacterized protein n=1 Tax=Daucus carota subsp. sativus TaxID=79200 RepID=A0A164W1G6_DAUCS|nr:PREDICTED: bZIP transcription factor 53-like [Daucus carota subsp. sativus]WOH05365.1 hypothetical protein DCAR_0624781 [Daucus carota subsp. sativus]
MASSSTTSGMQKAKFSAESKLKRMASNRESAKRSRIRKQRHLNDLTTQVSQLESKNNVIRTNMSMTHQMHVTLEAENSVLRAQLAELSQRLESLNQIMDCFNSNNHVVPTNDGDSQMLGDDDYFMDIWNIVPLGLSIEASADVFM